MSKEQEAINKGFLDLFDRNLNIHKFTFLLNVIMFIWLFIISVVVLVQ